MTKPHIAMRATAAIAALSLFVSGPAIAASQAAAVKAAASAIPAYSPWVMMSALASASSSAAVCAAAAAQATAAQATAAQATAAKATAAQLPTSELLTRAPGMGCVLPQLDPPLPPVTPPSVPPAAGVSAAAVPAGVGFLPIFLGLVSIAGIAMLGLSGTAGGARVQNSPT